VSVAVTSGLYLRGAGRLFCALLAGHEKCKQLLSRMTVSVTRGREGSQLTKSHPLMMMGNQFFQVLGRVKKMTAVIRSMLSDMRRGK
jgi:hypothetical protein